ncbi:tocopherol cyclase family protein [Leptolyngbya iicbica]|uniref:Tocopherol cyclase n=2 Tax=Cyanophyceae TaxID=3028117 RepID=A0A4Q7EGQ2_9CYAN|nr:tocopherol cyclase family protein [Leptolyngbya sp. LK]RZM82267.1 tocopherol cyclase [Leptolyngbya sp. LK]
MPDFFWTPHSGYHWDGSARRFFEGWYVRLTLPTLGETFAFMYSIDDPAGQSTLSGGAAQILGPEEQYHLTWLPELRGFWAWPHRLGVGHWQRTADGQRGGYLPSAEFWDIAQQGYQLTATQHQGCLVDAATGAIARWHYDIDPVYGWGAANQTAQATAGWLSYLPIFEPGWQVLMAHGLATGWAEWQGRRYEFEQAPTYMEKNWGGAFPQRWFWVQANAFAALPDLTITAVGGKRQVLGREETVGLVGLHWAGQCISMTSLRAAVTWQVAPWGHWQMTIADHRYRIVLQGRSQSAPAQVRVPTLEGLRFECWDTTRGQLTVEVWQRSPLSISDQSLILKAETHLAALEVGGKGWQQPWHFVQGAI